MKLIIDTNIIFSALLKDGFTRSLLVSDSLDLYIPNYVFQELHKHIPTIIKKTGLPRNNITEMLTLLENSFTILCPPPIKFLMAAESIMDSIDPKDTPILASALHKDIPLWSDDKHFQNQSLVIIYTTKDVVDLLSNF